MSGADRFIGLVLVALGAAFVAFWIARRADNDTKEMK